ncbi:hypothetical protein J6590_043623 [Homalodisca vitripennis]|nr:hypothetical protein J6590_043623 [Homalodisca vitripennis]
MIAVEIMLAILAMIDAIKTLRHPLTATISILGRISITAINRCQYSSPLTLIESGSDSFIHSVSGGYRCQYPSPLTLIESGSDSFIHSVSGGYRCQYPSPLTLIESGSDSFIHSVSGGYRCQYPSPLTLIESGSDSFIHSVSGGYRCQYSLPLTLIEHGDDSHSHIALAILAMIDAIKTLRHPLTATISILGRISITVYSGHDVTQGDQQMTIPELHIANIQANATELVEKPNKIGMEALLTEQPTVRRGPASSYP